jgi:hypothetical protein
MAAPDKVFQQTYTWYNTSVDRLLAASLIPAAEQPAVRQMIWQMLGVLNPAAPPANPDLTDFKDNGAAADSLALACQVIAEALAALGYVKQAVDGLDGRTWMWIGRSKVAGRGEAQSALRFDVAVKRETLR